MIRKATNNTNGTKKVKNDSVPDKVVQKSVSDNQFPQIYNLRCFTKILNDAEQKKKQQIEKQILKKKKIKSPVEKGRLVLVLRVRLQKKDAPGKINKSTI